MKTTYTMDDMMEMSAGESPAKKFGTQGKKKKMSPEEFMVAVKGLIAQMENSNEYPNMESDTDSSDVEDAEEENMTAGYVGENSAIESEDDADEQVVKNAPSPLSPQDVAANKASEDESSAKDKKVRLAAARVAIKKLYGKA